MTADLSRILAPRSIAVLGASDDPAKPGGRVLDFMRRHDYRGQVFPVSKNRAVVQGMAAYRTLADVPGRPDVVVIALAEAAIPEALNAAIEAGAAAAIIYASGYAEMGDAGRAQQAHIADIAKQGGLRLIGPNTQGVANFATGAIAHFGVIIDQVTPRRSPIGVVSQSGAGSQIVYARLDALDIGAKYLVATGNEADIDVAEIVQAYVDDSEIELVLVYAESIKRPQVLARAASAARARGVPVLMVKAGRTQSGQRTAASHTGALASEDRLIGAFLDRAGILRVNDFEALAELSQMFLGERGRRGRRLVSMSNSGATCVLSADAAEAAGLTLSTFDDGFKRQLAEVLPAYITPGNPIDMTTATLKNPQMFEQTLACIAQADVADLLFVGFPIGGRGYDFDKFARELQAFSVESGIPVAVSVNQAWAIQCFRACGIPVFTSERRAIEGLARLADYHDRVAAMSGQAESASATSAVSTAVVSTPPADSSAHRKSDQDAIARLVRDEHQRADSASTLNEADSLSLLARSGLPVVRHAVCHDVYEAIECWQAWGRPKIVMKGVSDSIAHKSEHGLVKLGLATEHAVKASAEQLRALLRSLGDPAARLMLADMVPADFELMIGAHVDPQLGPMLAIGQGGMLVEALNDIQFLMAPATEDDVLRAIAKLDVARAFGAWRGLQPVNVHALAQILLQLGDMLTQDNGNIRAIDINPVRVLRGMHRPVIVDALIDVRHRSEIVEPFHEA